MANNTMSLVLILFDSFDDLFDVPSLFKHIKRKCFAAEDNYLFSFFDCACGQ